MVLILLGHLHVFVVLDLGLPVHVWGVGSVLLENT